MNPSRHRLATRLQRVLRGKVLFDEASRGRYATDASIYQVMPVGVVVPHDEADVVAAMDLAREEGVPILARGAGTSQCGQTVGEALVLDTSVHLDGIVRIDADGLRAEVQPGVVLDRLNARLRPLGLWFPVDVSTSAQATLGGMAGNNSCGSRSIAYGNMVHNVEGIDAILSDGTQEFFGPFGPKATRPMSSARTARLVSQLFSIGQRERAEIERVWPTVMRRVGGYNLDVFCSRSPRPYTEDGSVNLAHLLVGSEGTLAFFRRLHLKLSPLPAHRVLGVVNFGSFHQAMDSAQHIVTLAPSAVELVDRTMVDLSRGNPVFRPVIDQVLHGQPDALLLVEFSGDDRGCCLESLARLHELMADRGGHGVVIDLVDEAPQKALWNVRKAGLNIMMSLRGDAKPVSFIEDCAVPLEHLADYTARLTEVFARHGTRGTWYAHASVGTLHVRPILDMRREGPQGGAARMRAIAEEAAELVRRFKGAYSGEHGDGLVRSEWVRWQFGPRLTQAFEEVKDAFDPAALLNPGKIVRAPRMDDTRLFRHRPDHRVIALKPVLDWSHWDVLNDPKSGVVGAPGRGGDPAGGLAKAIDMCNNNGHCRKFDAEVMCPSWRVTRNERDLVRGRANTLRLALSGQLGQAGVASAPVREALDLCVSCKGCRRECPTGIDMARIKMEVLAHHRKTTALRVREKLVAWLPRYAPVLSRVAPLINGAVRAPFIRALAQRYVGLAAKRSLPVWRRDVFTRDRAFATSLSPGGREVVLLPDTFGNYFEPEALRAATLVLRAAGYEVTVASAPPERDSKRPLCCGRTLMSVGLVEEARLEARRTLEALMPWIRRGVAVVGLEPSCLLSFRDEYLAMGLGHDAEQLARGSWLFEEFLERELAEGRCSLPLVDAAGARVLLHGHCHQKAFGVMGAVQRLLGRVPGLDVQVLESSCCGMAGSFGYEAEHHAASLRMGELSLLPAVREAAPETIVVADGTSCRHQIHDATSRRAIHVAVLLERFVLAAHSDCLS